MPNQVIVLLTEKGEALGSSELYGVDDFPALIEHKGDFFVQSKGSRYLYYRAQPLELFDISVNYRDFGGNASFEGEEGGDWRPSHSDLNSDHSNGDKWKAHELDPLAFNIKRARLYPQRDQWSETVTTTFHKPPKKAPWYKRMFSSL